MIQSEMNMDEFAIGGKYGTSTQGKQKFGQTKPVVLSGGSASAVAPRNKSSSLGAIT